MLSSSSKIFLEGDAIFFGVLINLLWMGGEKFSEAFYKKFPSSTWV